MPRRPVEVVRHPLVQPLPDPHRAPREPGLPIGVGLRAGSALEVLRDQGKEIAPIGGLEASGVWHGRGLGEQMP
jgi:hypothetical protein